MRAEQPTKLCTPKLKMIMKIGAQSIPFNPPPPRTHTYTPSSYYWPFQGGIYVAISLALCSVLFISFLKFLNKRR